MAIFKFLSNTVWNSYSDIAGGTVTARSATELQYVSANGFNVTLHGTGFQYDSLGVPTGGKVRGLDVFNDQNQLAHYTGLTTALTRYAKLGLGQTHGAADISTPDMETLYADLRSGSDVIRGSDYGRTYPGYSGNDTFYGGAGDDWFYGGDGYDTYYGGGGRDGVSFSDHNTTFVQIWETTSSFHVLNDGFGYEEWGLGGIEMLETTNGNDHVSLSGLYTSIDTIWLLGGNDRLDFSSHSNATVYGGGGNNSIFGGSVVDGGDGVDYYGGADYVAFWSADDGGHGASVDLTAATSQILDDGFGNAEGCSFTLGFYGTRFNDRFIGSSRLDEFWGNDGNDFLSGGDERDNLFGGDGKDRIFGGTGDDTVAGGAGYDVLSGGAGTDELDFWDVQSTGHGVLVNIGRAKGQVQDDGYGNLENATGFENLVGSKFGDNLTGNALANVIWGDDGRTRCSVAAAMIR